MLISEIPKIELHRHLEGSLRLSTLVELSGLNLEEARARFQVLEPKENLKVVLDSFTHSQKLLGSLEVLERISFECVEDAFKDNIKILELRYAPSFLCRGHAYSIESAHEAILRGCKSATDKYDIEVGLIGIIVRAHSMAVAEKSMEFFLDPGAGFTGVDLADNEEDFEARLFEVLFSKARLAGMPITIHAGEVPGKKSPQNVLDAVNRLGATRIGHGLQIIHRPDVIEELVKKNIHLELCPLSNWITNAISNKKDHPFLKLRALGLSCSINSDDPGIFATNLISDYEFLNQELGMPLSDMHEANKAAYQASFLKSKNRFASLFT